MHVKANILSVVMAYGVAVVLLSFGVISLIIITFRIIPIEPADDFGLLIVFSAIFTLGSAYIAYTVFCMPVRASVDSLGSSIFSSPLRVTKIGSNDIKKIVEFDADYVIHHKNGKLDLQLFAPRDIKGLLAFLVKVNSIDDVPDKLNKT